MANKDYDKEDGVWRTIGGRRVFIRNGQSLSDAMKESGKFKNKNASQITLTHEEYLQSLKDDATTKTELDEIDKEINKAKKEETKKEDNVEKVKKEKDEIEKSDPYDDPESEESQRLQYIQSRYDDYLQKTEGRGASYGELSYVENLRGKDLDDFEKELDDFEENEAKQSTNEGEHFDVRKYEVEVQHDKGKSKFNVTASDEETAKKMVMNSEHAPESAIIGVKDKGSILHKEEKSTNETMNDKIRSKASKKSSFKEDLPKHTEIKEQGNSNRKEVSENIQAHILDYYTEDYTGEDISPSEAFVRQMDAMGEDSLWRAGEKIAQGGSYLVYNGDMADFLDSLKINPKGKKFDDQKSFEMYTSLIGRESAKLYDRIKRNAFNKYKQEHPLTKMTFEEFKKQK